MKMVDLGTDLMNSIQALNASVWRNQVDAPTIELWLKEFGSDGQPGTDGRLHLLYLLSRFMYFGDEEVRALLRALYRDHYRYPIVAKIRRDAGDTHDGALLDTGYTQILRCTRFLGMGNPSESGTHLLYHYRQENDLSSKLFINPHEIFDLTQKEPALADTTISRYIFIDDFCGSGSQGVRYSQTLLRRITEAGKQAGVQPRTAYHVLIGTSKGLERVREEAQFDEITCVLELDESFRAFRTGSRYFENAPDGIERERAQTIAQHFGEQLSPTESLGYNDGQLMIGFFHNTPNNTLPIFWHPGSNARPWYPIFRRYYKNSSPLGSRRSD